MSDILLQSISIPVWITKTEKARPSFLFYLGYESVRKHINTIYRWNKRLQAGWANGLREVFSGSANSRGIAKGERRRRRRRKKESYFCRSLWRPARRRVILKTFRIKHRQFWTVRKTCGTIYVDSNVVASCTVSSRSLERKNNNNTITSTSVIFLEGFSQLLENLEYFISFPLILFSYR